MVALSGRRPAAWIAAALLGVALASPAPVQALITPPATIAGPSSDIVDFGGVAMAPDGSGGLVYTKVDDGVPHIFVSRYVEDRWSAPIRVDGDQPYEAAQPRIAAGRGGALLVVWITQVATVKSRPRYGLFSAAIGRGASSFGPSQVVDPDVGEGIGVDPSLSAPAPSQAIVAYRVITYKFDGSKPSTAVQLRPGDVLAEFRVARLKDDRWSRLGAINANLETSTRAPGAGNGPKVGAGVDGNAVVAWQEPDQTGAARIYLRRIFGTVLGPILQASPSSWEGTPVSGDAEFSLAVTPLDQARIAMRIAGNGGGPARLFLNTLPPGYAVPSSALLGVTPVFTAESAAAQLGLPGVAAYEKGGQQGLLRLAFATGGQVRQVGVDGTGKLTPAAPVTGPPAVPGAEVATAVDPAGGGVVAYSALDPSAGTALAVDQEFPSGAAQLGLVSAAQGGPIAQLRIDGSGSGDALIGFRQGEPGHFQIVGERVSAPPTSFKVKGPKGWTRPRQVKLSWQPAGSAVGGVTYTVLLGDRTARRGLRGRLFRLPAGLLGNGRSEARVLATDALGQQVLSKPVKLLVDGEPPLIRLSGPHAGRLRVRVFDRDSGTRKRSTWVSFGDGSREDDAAGFRHLYARPGRYEVTVHSADRVGNRVTRRFAVRVR